MNLEEFKDAMGIKTVKTKRARVKTTQATTDLIMMLYDQGMDARKIAAGMWIGYPTVAQVIERNK